MARMQQDFQPGLILLDALTGAFRARGTSFEAWCKENQVQPMNLRNAALGGSRSDAARKWLEDAIEAAGRDLVMTAYRARIIEHARALQKGAA